MTELNLWGSFLDRNDVQALSIEKRMLLISVATTVADCEPDIEGFLARGDIRSVPWHDPLDAGALLDELGTDNHFIRVLDEPDGWIICGWTDQTVRYQAGNSKCAEPAWGQTPKQKLLKQRESARERQERSRQKKNEHPNE